MLKHTFEVCTEEVGVNNLDAVKKGFWLFQLSDVQWVRPQPCDESKLITSAWSSEVTGAVFAEIHPFISVKIRG